MYDIRQFKPVLYALLALGISGFALAAQSPGLWTLSLTALFINAWLIKTRRFRPIPHWLANLFTVFALLVLAAPLKADPTRAVLVIGQFLVVLQLVKLYEQRANRDYAQLLVLSLLLMVAASINTASLLFGVMLIGYLFLSLFCCLLFHLKVETDYAKAAIGLPEQDSNPVTLRQDQRYLSKSMRRLTGAVAVVAIAMAVTVFLLFPRGAGAGLLGPLQLKQSQSLSGFSDTVSFQRIAQISQNNAQIAWVKVFKDGKLVRGGTSILLRGVALDRYNGDDSSLGPTRQWVRTTADQTPRDIESGQILKVAPDRPRWVQQVSLSPTGTPYLFAMNGLCRFDKVNVDVKPRYWTHDEVLQTPEVLSQQIEYTVESSGKVMSDDGDDGQPASAPTTAAPTTAGPTTAGPTDADAQSRRGSWIAPEVAAYARRPEVSGSNGSGPLATQRNKSRRVDRLDPIIAQNICEYLQRNFTYTLDLTDAKNIGDRDPLVAFLTDFKRGHCEYFAGSMALMCQSLGMQARVVVGFKCDEYNTMLEQYSVHQSHAHAWVEVLNPTGEWQTFDPTSGRGDDAVASSSGIWRKSMQLVEYLQFTWANSVVAYDQDSRSNLISNVDRSLTNSAINSQVTASKARQWITDHVDFFASRATAVLMVVMLVTVIFSVAFFTFERWRLRRRARRIGVETLPQSDQVRLLRQLGFYDELLTLLEKHRIARPKHLTPMEFSRSIDFLPLEMFTAIQRLTRIFYHVRYGRRELSAGQRRHLDEVITRVSAGLDRAKI